MACENKNPCSCTAYSCAHHGKCCECIAYHRALNEVPGCLFSKKGEATWDRSLKALFEDRKGEIK